MFQLHGPHAASAKDCPVWKKEKEIRGIHVEKRISFPETRQLVEAKPLSTVFSSGESFEDVVNGKTDGKICSLSNRSHPGFFGHSYDLTWVSLDAPM